MRKYTGLDLIRFKRFADENPKMKPINLVEAYNKKHPELSAKQQYENIVKMLGHMEDMQEKFNNDESENKHKEGNTEC